MKTLCRSLTHYPPVIRLQRPQPVLSTIACGQLTSSNSMSGLLAFRSQLKRQYRACCHFGQMAHWKGRSVSFAFDPCWLSYSKDVMDVFRAYLTGSEPLRQTLTVSAHVGVPCQRAVYWFLYGSCEVRCSLCVMRGIFVIVEHPWLMGLQPPQCSR